MSSCTLAPYASTIACALLLGSGCVPSLAQNKPREADKTVPSDYGATEAHGDGTRRSAGAAQSSWHEFFDDPDLKALIDSALEENQELSMRLQEIIIARSEVMSRRGDYQPRVDARVGAGVEKVGKYTSQGASDEAHGVPTHLQDYQLGFAASWEVDIWRRLHNAAKAANYRYLSTIEGRNFLVTQVVAEIATSFYELMAVDNRLEVLKRNIAIQETALEIVRLEKQAARVTELAVQRFEAEVAKNQGRKYELEQQRIEAENRINVLLGRYPQQVTRDPRRLSSSLLDVVETGIPAQLLDNRPDVRQAELELEAAKLDVKAAKAAFYPALSIDAEVGYGAFNMKHLVTTPESLLYNLAGNLTAPLLNRKAIAAQYYTANARQLQAVLNYERILLGAFTEVVNQQAAIKNLRRRYELQTQQVSMLTRSTEISNVLFQSARADYMEVLLTRRDSLDAEMELIETRSRQMQAVVAMYQALGGGWN